MVDCLRACAKVMLDTHYVDRPSVVLIVVIRCSTRGDQVVPAKATNIFIGDGLLGHILRLRCRW